MTILNAFNFGYVLFAPDGSQIVATIINGIPVGLSYSAQGQFTGIVFGILPEPV